MNNIDADKILVERAKLGDKEAFDQLVEKYQYRIMKVISRNLVNQAELSDVAQETFIRAYRAISNFRGDSAFYTWLYRVAVNTAKNYTYKQSRYAKNVSIDTPDVEYQHFLKENDTPELLLLSTEIERKVFATIDNLPEELRVTIMLREIDNMSYKQIAARLKCPIGTVRSRIFRAREVLDSTIKPFIQK